MWYFWRQIVVYKKKPRPVATFLAILALIASIGVGAEHGFLAGVAVFVISAVILGPLFD